MKAKPKIERTSNALAILDRMAGGSVELQRLAEPARINATVAQLIYAARTEAGLSQAELAAKLGTGNRCSPGWRIPITTAIR